MVPPLTTWAWVSPLWSPIRRWLPRRQLPQSSTEVSDLLLFLISLIRTIMRFTGQMDGNPAGCPWGRLCGGWGEIWVRAGELYMNSLMELWCPLVDIHGNRWSVLVSVMEIKSHTNFCLYYTIFWINCVLSNYRFLIQFYLKEVFGKQHQLSSFKVSTPAECRQRRLFRRFSFRF